MKKNFLFLGFLILSISEFHSVFGQVPYPFYLKNNCEENSSTFWGHGEYLINDKKIFIIGRLGTLEKSEKLNLNRIEKVVSHLTMTHLKKGEISKDRIVTAQGSAMGKLGRVEVYGDGYLLLVFELGKNEQLNLGNCELQNKREQPTTHNINAFILSTGCFDDDLSSNENRRQNTLRQRRNR